VWDWKANARAALRLFRQKEADAKQALENYRKGARFKALVAAYNAARANGQAPQTTPAGRRASADCTTTAGPDQTAHGHVAAGVAGDDRNDTIRRYNGEPVIGEYVAMTTDGLLKVTPSADRVSGTAEWHEVSAQERKDAYDDYTSRTGKTISKNAYDAADYVGKVRGVPLN
jgi:hypothetical protein